MNHNPLLIITGLIKLMYQANTGQIQDGADLTTSEAKSYQLGLA